MFSRIRTGAALAVLAAFCGSPAVARNVVFPLNIADAMASKEMREKIDGSVKFYFGNASHPAVEQKFGEYVTNQKTSAFLKSDEAACTRVFTSTLLEFQKRAHELGANAVINIHSYYQKEDVSSDTDVQCHAGGAIAGIALKGDFVKVSGQ